jgi:hypothetical protein
MPSLQSNKIHYLFSLCLTGMVRISKKIMNCQEAATPDRRWFTNKCKSEGKWVALAIELCLIVVVPTRSWYIDDRFNGVLPLWFQQSTTREFECLVMNWHETWKRRADALHSCIKKFLSLAHFDKDHWPNRNVKRGEMKQEIRELNEKKKNRNERNLLSVANKMWHSCLYCPLSCEFKFENMINMFQLDSLK